MIHIQCQPQANCSSAVSLLAKSCYNCASRSSIHPKTQLRTHARPGAPLSPPSFFSLGGPPAGVPAAGPGSLHCLSVCASSLQSNLISRPIPDPSPPPTPTHYASTIILDFFSHDLADRLSLLCSTICDYRAASLIITGSVATPVNTPITPSESERHFSCSKNSRSGSTPSNKTTTSNTAVMIS